MSKKTAFIFDMDGTICDIKHRLNYINGDSKDWDAFNHACQFDIPKADIITILHSISMEYEVIIVTGRMDSNDTRDLTIDWLERHDVPYDAFFMRPNGNYDSDYKIKLAIYRELIEPVYDVVAVFDDRDQVVSMWREIGLTCCQVQPGDF